MPHLGACSGRRVLDQALGQGQSERTQVMHRLGCDRCSGLSPSSLFPAAVVQFGDKRNIW